MTVAMTEATDTEAEMLTMVLRQMMSDVVQHAGMPWKTIAVTIAVTIAEVVVAAAAADGVDLVVVARNGPAMTAVGVG